MKPKFNGFLVLLIVLFAQVTFAQERAVSGTVTDDAGLPLPGVSILIKGTKTGTQTDFDGKYSIKATPTQILIISYIGMKSQEITASSSQANTRLTGDAQQLEGVVVTTAMGIKREKKSLGYASQQIAGKDLNGGAGNTNVANLLSGKAAGVEVSRNTNFGGSTNVVIRGNKSLTGNNQALWVIDGVPIDNTNSNTSTQQAGRGGYDYGNNASDINQEDIESIRAKTGGKKSLDDVMRALWQRYGRDFYQGGARGVTPGEVEALFDEISGGRFKPFFDKYIRGTDDVPLAKLLAPFGVKYADERKAAKPSLDANLGRDGNDCKLSAVHENGAAHQAGLSAGDLLVAVDGLRVTATNLDTLLARYAVGATVEIHAFRRDELMTFSVVLQGDRVPGITLSLDPVVKKSTGPLRPSAAR